MIYFNCNDGDGEGGQIDFCLLNVDNSVGGMCRFMPSNQMPDPLDDANFYVQGTMIHYTGMDNYLTNLSGNGVSKSGKVFNTIINIESPTDDILKGESRIASDFLKETHDQIYIIGKNIALNGPLYF